jgi:hypothetical protein
VNEWSREIGQYDTPPQPTLLKWATRLSSSNPPGIGSKIQSSWRTCIASPKHASRFLCAVGWKSGGDSSRQDLWGVLGGSSKILQLWEESKQEVHHCQGFVHSNLRLQASRIAWNCLDLSLRHTERNTYIFRWRALSRLWAFSLIWGPCLVIKSLILFMQQSCDDGTVDNTADAG